jgi:hypothetical protein
VEILESSPVTDTAAGGVGTRPERDEQLIIREARRRRRRRYLVIAFALITAVGALLVTIALSQGSGGRAVSDSHRGSKPPPHVAPPASTSRSPSAVLPSSALFNQISATTNGLVLTGVTNANGENPTDNPQSECAAASLDPRSLIVGKIVKGSCGVPLLTGHTVEAMNAPLSSNNAAISLNVENPTTGQITHGPVVMTYESSSDTHPVVAYGSEWMWIYDVATSEGPELLQISGSSGAVVSTIRMPALYRPLLSADEQGVWVASSEGGSGAPALSYVTSGTTAATVVISDTNVPICWLRADPTSAWVGVGLQNACAKQMVERFEDQNNVPLFSVSGSFTPFNVIGDESDGLWTLQYGDKGPQIISINPQTGAETTVSTLPPIEEPVLNDDEGLLPDEAAYYDNALYILEPPYRLNGYLGYESVVRVAVHPPG